MAEVFALFLAGLSLFFYGVGGIRGHRQKAHLFYLTSLFERAVWLLRQLGLAHRCREG